MYGEALKTQHRRNLGLPSLGVPIHDNALSWGLRMSQTHLTRAEAPISNEDPIGNL